MARVDTVRTNYYRPAEVMEAAGSWLFWSITVLSIGVLFIDAEHYAVAAAAAQIALSVLVVLFFVQGQVQRLYLFPRAEDKRRQFLLSESFDVTLTHEEAPGYYNNDQTNPLKRLGASIMESAFFTKELVRLRLISTRFRTLGYLVAYLVALLVRTTDLELLSTAAMALFGGEIVARWLRLEWLRMRCEQVFENFNRLFSDRPSFARRVAQSEALEFYSFYETTKATACALIPTKLFEAQNPALSSQWEQIRARLGI